MLDLFLVRLRIKLHLLIALLDVKDLRNVEVAFSSDFVCPHEHNFEESTDCLVAHFVDLVGEKLYFLAKTVLEVEENGERLCYQQLILNGAFLLHLVQQSFYQMVTEILTNPLCKF